MKIYLIVTVICIRLFFFVNVNGRPIHNGYGEGGRGLGNGHFSLGTALGIGGGLNHGYRFNVGQIHGIFGPSAGHGYSPGSHIGAGPGGFNLGAGFVFPAPHPVPRPAPPPSPPLVIEFPVPVRVPIRIPIHFPAPPPAAPQPRPKVPVINVPVPVQVPVRVPIYIPTPRPIYVPQPVPVAITRDVPVRVPQRIPVNRPLNFELILNSGVTLGQCINQLTAGLEEYTVTEYFRLQQVNRITEKLMQFKYLGKVSQLTEVDPRISNQTIELGNELSPCSNLLYQGCIMLTPDQMDQAVRWALADAGVSPKQLLEKFGELYLFNKEFDASEHTSALPQLPYTSEFNTRYKRQITIDSNTRWMLPITYTIESDVSKSSVQSALGVWESETCVTFQETSLNLRQLRGNFITFKKGDSCASTVGKKPKKEGQVIFLTSECVQQKYSIVHEIGHALGLWHEHSRPDRSTAVSINSDNIEQNYLKEFVRATNADVNTNIHSYDHGSVMQYKSTAFGKSKESKTIEAKKSKNQLTMGQRQQLSFGDTKIINDVYCSGRCSTKLNCNHNGYTNPKRCNVCKCPEGFAGNLCQTVQPSSSKCGGELMAGSSEKEVSFSGQAKCYWLIKSSGTVTIKIKSLNFACRRTCRDYVELKIENNLGLTGGRFCCKKPSDTFKTSSSEAVIIYRGNADGELTFTYST